MRWRLLSGIVWLVAAVGCTTPVAIPTGCTDSTDCRAAEICADRVCVPRADAAVGCDGACECAVDADCRGSIATCADAACVGGTCFANPIDSRCAGSGRCDPTLGCVGGDTGASDAGVSTDTSTLDASVDARADAPAIDPLPDAPADAGPGGMGAPCTGAGDCAIVASSGRATCVTTFAGEAFDGGYCSADCPLGSTMACGAGATCVFVSGSPGGSGICLRTCRADGECRTGYDCQRVGFLVTETVCAPPGL